MSPPAIATTRITDEVDGKAMVPASQNMLPKSSISTFPQGKFLVLSDLRDELRILVVEDNYLRRATVFTGEDF